MESKKENFLILFGEQLKDIRKNKNISQEELAFRSNFDRTYISGLECGKRNPTLKILVKIAYSLDVPISQLLSKIDFSKENKENNDEKD